MWHVHTRHVSPMCAMAQHAFHPPLPLAIHPSGCSHPPPPSRQPLGPSHLGPQVAAPACRAAAAAGEAPDVDTQHARLARAPHAVRQPGRPAAGGGSGGDGRLGRRSDRGAIGVSSFSQPPRLILRRLHVGKCSGRKPSCRGLYLEGRSSQPAPLFPAVRRLWTPVPGPLQWSWG